MKNNRQKKIGIIGRGNFGIVLKKLFKQYASAYSFLLFDKKKNSDEIDKIETLSQCEVVVIAVPISKFELVVKQIGPYLKSDAIVIDVCSVKQHPAEVMRRHLPKNVGILASHPMFGPESLAAKNWQLKGLNMVFCPVRVNSSWFDSLVAKMKSLDFNILVLSPEEHDAYMAKSQFLSLYFGTLLNKLHISATPIDTPAFKKLLEISDMIKNDYRIVLDAYKYSSECKKSYRVLKKEMATIEKNFTGKS